MTAKELARKLHLSEATVSLVLNGKPGIKKATRDRVLAAAKEHHICVKDRQNRSRNIYLLRYKAHQTALSDSSFSDAVIEGMELACRDHNYFLNTRAVIGRSALISQMKLLKESDIAGLLIMGNELTGEDIRSLIQVSYPIVLVDSMPPSSPYDSVTIDNIDGAFTAVNFLISRCGSQPGYLRSSFPINNFDERRTGFNQALRYNGMAPSASIIHLLPPSIDGAYGEMSALLQSGIKLASCYFADDDLIAIGALRAFRDHNIKIPDDVAVIGFDDIMMSTYTEPPLTTIHVPRHQLGAVSIRRLLDLIDDPISFPVRIQVTTSLVIRESIR